MSEDGDQPLIALAERIAGLDAVAARSARLLVHEQRLRLRLRARQRASLSRLFDSVAKFGGGSLLTAVLLLLLGGRLQFGILVTALVTVVAFLGGTCLTIYMDREAAKLEWISERLDAVLKEMER